MIHAGVPSGHVDAQLRTVTGEYRWHHGQYSLVYDEQHMPLYALITFFDNTERRENELAAEKWSASLSSLLSEAFLYAEINLTRNAVELLSTGLSPKDGATHPTTLDDVAALGLDGEASEETQAEYRAFFSRQRLLGLFAENVREDKMDFCVMPAARGKDAPRPKWCQAGVRMIQSPHSGDIMAGISFTPLETPQKQLEAGLANIADLTHKAYHDHLTGLLNREGFTTQVENTLARHDPAQTTVLFMIDLDNFKQINDRLGHQVGDMVLCRVGDALRATFRAGDLLGRLGGDEFIVLLQGPLTQAHLEQKALELLHAVRLKDEGLTLPVSVSIGVVFGRSKQPFERLYRMADIALYTSKKAGKNRFHIINSDTNEEQTYTGHEEATGFVSLQDLLQAPEDGPLQKKSRTPYEALLENIPGGVVTLEIGHGTFKLTTVNDWLFQFLDYSREELAPRLDKNPFCIIHPEDRRLVKDGIRNVLKGQDYFNATFRMRTRHGQYKYSSLNASITVRKDNLVLMQGIHTDVDKMMHLQRELERSRKQLEHMMNSIPGGIVLLEFSDTLRTHVYGNWMFSHSGFSPQELQALTESTEFALVHDDDKHLMQAFYDRFKQGEDYASVSLRLHAKHKGPVPVLIKGTVIERTPKKISVYALFLED